jgi:RNA polymerase sigma-70 factor, ECF subfamily
MRPRNMAAPHPSDAERERFERWVRDHHAALFQSAWRIVRSRADADDVVSQLFLELLERPDAIASHPEPARALRWLAVKRALTFRRGEANRRRREEAHAMGHPEVEGARGGDDPREQAARREQLRAVREQVTALPEELRIATVLRFQEGLTFAEMAELAEVSEPTMFERVARALEKLRGALTRAGHGAVAVELEGLLAIEEVAAVSPKLATTLLALAKGSAAAGAGAGVGIGGGWLVAAAAVVVLAGGAIALRATRTMRTGGGPRAASEATAARRDGGVANSTTAVARRESEPPHAPEARSIPVVAETPEPPPAAPAHLRGTVIDDEDRTFARVHVTASSHDRTSKGSTLRAEGDTQDDGSFDLKVDVREPEGQQFTVVLAHDDALPRVWYVTVKAGETFDFGRMRARRDVTERPGEFELTLRIVGPQGEPIPQAQVQLHRKLVARGNPAPADEPTMTSFALRPEADDVTDASGAVVLRGHHLGAKLVEIRAREQGYRYLRADLRVDVTGASTQEVRLEPGLTIGGRLAMVDGGVADWSRGSVFVQPAPGNGSRDDEPYFAQLQPDGRFLVRGLDPGRWRVKLYGAFAAAQLDDVEAGSEGLVVELKRRDDPRDVGCHMAEVHARAVDAKDGAAVVIDPDDFDVVEVPAGWQPDDPRIESELLPAEAKKQRAQTLFDGTEPPPTNLLHVTGLDAGNYLLVVHARGFAPGISRVVTLKAREIVSDLVVPLKRSE